MANFKFYDITKNDITMLLVTKESGEKTQAIVFESDSSKQFDDYVEKMIRTFDEYYTIEESHFDDYSRKLVAEVNQKPQNLPKANCNYHTSR